MCKVLKVSRSCFYQWLYGSKSKRQQESEELLIDIKTIFEKSKHTYGSPRITQELKRQGKKVSRPRVAKIMKNNGLFSKVKKKYKVTTDSNHTFTISENVLDRNFTPLSLNQAWVSDITYIKTKEGWLYLTTIIDLFNRQVIGWSLSNNLFAKNTTVPAFKMALTRRKIIDKLIFHSDRGVQYACKEFRACLNKYPHIVQSMSRKGNCWDNAVAESFFKTLKTELIYHLKNKSKNFIENIVFEYIETWYNRKRLHSALGYKTPAEIELEYIILKLKNVA